MDLLGDLDHSFQIAAAEDASSEAEIAALTAFSEIPVPPEYVSIIRRHAELELSVSGTGYLRIWGAGGCVEMNEAYQIQKYIPGSLAIGDDGGGNVLLYTAGEAGLYAVPLNDLGTDGLTRIADSLAALLVGGEGVRALAAL